MNGGAYDYYLNYYLKRLRKVLKKNRTNYIFSKPPSGRKRHRSAAVKSTSDKIVPLKTLSQDDMAVPSKDISFEEKNGLPIIGGGRRDRGGLYGESYEMSSSPMSSTGGSLKAEGLLAVDNLLMGQEIF